MNDERSKDGGPTLGDDGGFSDLVPSLHLAVAYTISGSGKRVDAQWIARIDDEEEDAAPTRGAAATLRTPGGRPGHGARSSGARDGSTWNSNGRRARRGAARTCAAPPRRVLGRNDASASLPNGGVGALYA